MTYQELYAVAEHLYTGLPMYIGKPFADQSLEEQLRFVNMAAEDILLKQYCALGFEALPEEVQQKARAFAAAGLTPLYGPLHKFDQLADKLKCALAGHAHFLDQHPHAYHAVLD